MAAFVTPALAAGNAADGLQEMRELNLIVLGSMSGGHDVEGKTFVGGDLTNGAQFGLGRGGQTPLASMFPTLTVVGSVVSGTNHILSGVSPAGATIGGSINGIAELPNYSTVLVGGSIGGTNGATGATIEAGGPIPSGSIPGSVVQGGLGATFINSLVASLNSEKSTLIADLKALSSALAALPATGSYNNSDPNNATFTSAPTSLGYGVIDITAAQYQNAASFIYKITTPTIINVNCATASKCGSTITDNANSNNGAYDNDVLFNFEGATNIAFNRQVSGSVLAPYATVSNVTPIEGTLAAASFNQGGELHQFAFASSLGGALGPSGVPEAATWAMMLVGFGLAGAALRRRRVAVAA
jgi:choice-of-anchor A domain-containing protein